MLALQYAVGAIVASTFDDFWAEPFDIGKVPVREFDIQPASAQRGKADT